MNAHAARHDFPRRAQCMSLDYLATIIGIVSARFPRTEGPCLTRAELVAAERRYHAGDTAEEFAQRVIMHRTRLEIVR